MYSSDWGFSIPSRIREQVEVPDRDLPNGLSALRLFEADIFRKREVPGASLETDEGAT